MKYFTIFLNLDYNFFLKLHTTIACDNVQHLVEVKLPKTFWGSNFGPNEPKSSTKLGFSGDFSSFVHQFSFKLHTMIAWNNVRELVEVKIKKKNFGARNQVFCHFLKFPSLAFHDIAQDCSLGQFLTLAELKPPNNFCGPNQALTGSNHG